MSNKNFIRLNVNDNYLSLGNLFRIIKEEASTTLNTFWQPSLFSIIFNTDDIADSTVNNYCTGLRAIHSKYKNYFREIQDSLKKDNTILVTPISKILELLENTTLDISTTTIEQINQSSKLKHVCNRLYSISKNDSDVSLKLSNTLYINLEKGDLYTFICHVLFYVILDKKQPIYMDEKINSIIEKNIYDTNISVHDIQNFINLQLNSGIWSIRGIKELAKQNNPFACFEMASMECYGIISGKPRYDEAYTYYKIAANYNHPVANWAIGYLYYNGHIGNKTRKDLFLAFKYFNRARKLKCSNAYNSIGLMILNGYIPHIENNRNVAIKMFHQALSLGNIYAYNNLGFLYEKEKNYQKAYSYYIVSADLGESWAANRIGEFYRNGIIKGGKNLKKAFIYYTISSESPKFTLCPWSKYNLAKYFYENGNLEIEIPQDINKSISLLEDISTELPIAAQELLYIYYKLYLKKDEKQQYYLEKLNFYKSQCESNSHYNKNLKKEIEKMLKQIYKSINPICLP